jgi:hypothetical protein
MDGNDSAGIYFGLVNYTGLEDNKYRSRTFACELQDC